MKRKVLPWRLHLPEPRWILLYGLVTQDWLGALRVGGALGGKAMLRTVGYEFCAGFVVGLIAPLHSCGHRNGAAGAG
ncbi:MAG: hypothetical protein ACLRT5_01180 [Lachnospiraceae bacterium]